MQKRMLHRKEPKDWLGTSDGGIEMEHKITAREIFDQQGRADKEKIADFLHGNMTSKRIFRHDYTEQFYEDLVKRRDNKIMEHLVITTWGFTGCLAGYTKIKGQTKTLNELGDGAVIKTKSLDMSSTKIVDSESKVSYSGKKKVYRIFLSDGRTVDATKDHKFFVRKGKNIIEKKMGYLRVGSHLVTDDGYI